MDFDFNKYCTISNDYFNWMYDLVCHNRYSHSISYRKLLMHLHGVEFLYLLRNDENRYTEGQGLKYRYLIESKNDNEVLDYLDGPCTVLEMILALALRCEESIMDDPKIGNRMQQWFWGMITNLGLGGMVDERYDKEYVQDVIDRFLNRQYDRDGRGGLFLIRDCKEDLRNVEIWCQLCWYLDTIT